MSRRSQKPIICPNYKEECLKKLILQTRNRWLPWKLSPIRLIILLSLNSRPKMLTAHWWDPSTPNLKSLIIAPSKLETQNWLKIWNKTGSRCLWLLIVFQSSKKNLLRPYPSNNSLSRKYIKNHNFIPPSKIRMLRSLVVLLIIVPSLKVPIRESKCRVTWWTLLNG